MMSLKSNPKAWAVISAGLILAAICFWKYGDTVQEQRRLEQAISTNQQSQASPAIPLLSETAAVRQAETVSSTQIASQPSSTSATGSGATGVAAGDSNASPQEADAEAEARREEERLARLEAERERYPHRYRNTDRPLDELLNDDRAILMNHAFIDTRLPVDWTFPQELQPSGDPGAYIVQADGPVNEDFRLLLASFGARVVSYIPNNSYLVETIDDPSGQRMQRLAESGLVQAVVPMPPAVKLDSLLLESSIRRESLPAETWLRVVFFPGKDQAGTQRLESMGMEVKGTDSTPFGEMAIVNPNGDRTVELAQMREVLGVEVYYPRQLANDLTRIRLNVVTNFETFSQSNYLALTGEGVLVNVNDTGVDETHPGLQGRVTGDSPQALIDFDGHGTHVAGTIAGDGSESPFIDEKFGSGLTPDFRGIAYKSDVFVMPIDLVTGPLMSDQYLQETAARTNALISNNSWGYVQQFEYNFASASYDAAVRDALREVTGEQPVLYVFSAGNSGSGSDNGLGGEPGTINAPATGKNVITVGAIEHLRNLTNEVVSTNMFGGIELVETNMPFLPPTDSSNQVVNFSSRGNVGIGQEGERGRFKPDVVAPGSFVISARSTNWVDPEAFVSPIVSFFQNQELDAGSTNLGTTFIPSNAETMRIRVLPNTRSATPMPDLNISAGPAGGPLTPRGVNDVTFNVTEGTWSYAIENPSGSLVNYDLQVIVFIRSVPGNYFDVLEEMNDVLAPYYRFESGTSMAAPAVTGMLALMQEFFTQRLEITNSPAMMKALLINGSRSVNRIYSYAVRDLVNYQGWGKVNLNRSIPPALDSSPEDSEEWPVRLFDKSGDEALITGNAHTYEVELSEDARFFPLRVTLAWTDPPGNPLAAVKLVNDLDLVVTNLDSGEVWLGNNFPIGEDFVDSDTNAISDKVNNVENVYINAPLGTNFTVTVRGSRVNVNAVTSHPDNTAQDYALVISTAESTLTGALTITERSVPTPDASVDPLVPVPTTVLRNAEPLLNRRVAANPPYLETTNGAVSQWDFYIFTNAIGSNPPPADLTNLAVATFLPPNVSTPRETQEGDLDLYVTDDSRLTNLNSTAVFNAIKSVRRGGTEAVVLTNAVPGAVYYIGVKSEDQKGVEYGLVAAASSDPFAECDEQGCFLRPIIPDNGLIPDGSPDDPGGLPIIFPGPPESLNIRRTLVTNSLAHQSPGDLLINLSHDDTFSVLQNNRQPVDGPPEDPRFFVYDDSGEQINTPPPFPFARIPSDGPGSLLFFNGQEGQGPWNMTVVDNSLNFTGSIDIASLYVERQPDLEEGIDVLLQPGERRRDSIQVRAGATNLVFIISNLVGQVDLYVRRDIPPTTDDFDKVGRFSAPGGVLTLNPRDVPPLSSPATYHTLLVNPPTSGTVADFRFYGFVEYDLNADTAKSHTITNSAPLIDDALTNSMLSVSNFQQITEIEMGLRIEHDRAADLSVYLTSPRGTRVLLTENRGRTNELGYGEGGPGTEKFVPVYTQTFESIRRGTYGMGETFADWTVLTNEADVLFNPANAYLGSRLLSLNDAVISNTLPTSAGTTYELMFARRLPGLDDRLEAWYRLDADAFDSAGANNGFLNGNPMFATGLVANAMFLSGADSVEVPASASLNVGQADGFTIEGWVFPDNTNSRMPLVEWNDQAGGVGVNLWINRDASDGSNLSGSLSADVVDDTGTSHTLGSDSNLLDRSEWQHVALTYDSLNGEGVLYLDGTEVARQNLGSFVPQTSFDLFLGERASGLDSGTFLAGGLDEIGIYRRALSGCEITAIVLAGDEGRGQADLSGCTSAELTRVNIDGINVRNFIATPEWEEERIRFTPTVNDSTVTIAGNAKGVLIDNISLSEVVFDAPLVYTRFSDNTNVALAPIKFGDPPYASNSVFEVLQTTGFEDTASGPGTYNQGDAVEDNWEVLTNRVDVVQDVNRAFDGSHFLATAAGTLRLTNFTAVPGAEYNLTLSHRDAGMVSWWPAEDSALDVMERNNGLFLDPTYVDGYVNRAFDFNGTTGRRVIFSDSDPFKLVNSFSIEGWVNIDAFPATGVSPVLARGDNRDVFPYFLGVNSAGEMVFHIESETNSVELTSTAVNLDEWVHVGAVFDGDAGEMLLYLNGVLDNSVSGVADRPLVNLESTSEPEVAIGGHRSNNLLQPLDGQVDELTLYDRALTFSEIEAIAVIADADGKAGAGNEPSPEPSLSILLNGLTTNNVIGSPIWQTQTFSFVNDTNQLVIDLIGNPHGMLLDELVLSQTRSFNHFLAEEALDTFVGENGGGEWQLTVWDNRLGEAIDANLISWELNLTFANTNAGCIELRHAQPVTNSIVGGAWQYYCVDVPRASSFATNVLQTDFPVEVWFNQTGVPEADSAGLGDVEFFNGVTDTRAILGTNGLERSINGIPQPFNANPQLQPGQRYFLGVRNLNPAVTNNIAIGVEFDLIDGIVRTTNGVQVTSNIEPGLELNYFQIDISTNASTVVFDILNADADVDLLVAQGPTLPGTNRWDFQDGVFDPAIRNKRVVVDTNAVASLSGRWYAAAWNQDTNAGAFEMRITEVYGSDPATVDPAVVVFTNLVDRTALAGTQQAGVSLTNYYRFQVSGSPRAVLFEVYANVADVDLLVGRDQLPSIVLSDYSSTITGLSTEQVVLRTNAALPDLNGDWYLGIPNNDSIRQEYTVRAATPIGGILPSGQPIRITDFQILGGTNVQFSFNTVIGENFQVQAVNDLSVIPIPWTPLFTVQATGITTIVVDTNTLPPPPLNKFYRIQQVP